MAIRFRELKKYISRVDRISICFHDGHYDNYSLISDIPEGKYDDLYVFGIGMADVEFPLDVYSEPPKDMPRRISKKDGYFLGCGLEIVVQEEARDIVRNNEETLVFEDLRDYLQIGRNFCVMIQGEWEPEQYEWKRDIPIQYDDMYVYGIGIENNPNARCDDKYIYDTCFTKQMVIVLSKNPK